MAIKEDVDLSKFRTIVVPYGDDEFVLYYEFDSNILKVKAFRYAAEEDGCKVIMIVEWDECIIEDDEPMKKAIEKIKTFLDRNF